MGATIKGNGMQQDYMWITVKVRMVNKQEVRWQRGNRDKYDTSLLHVNGGPFPHCHRPFCQQNNPLVCTSMLTENSE